MTKEGLLDTAEYDGAVRRFWTRRKLGAVSMALTMTTALGLSNTDELERFGYLNLEGSWATSFGGCYIEPVREPALDILLTEEEEQDYLLKKQVETEYEDVTSGAHNLDIFGYTIDFLMGAGEFAKQSIEYTFVPETRFTMEQSGIEVVIYAPENVQIDTEAFAELFHAPFYVPLEKFEHKEVRQLIECYREAAIEERQFEGEVYRVYVAPDKGYCIKNGRFQLAADVEDCDGYGFSPPLVDIDLLGYTLAEYRFLMQSTTSVSHAANQYMSKRLIHEGSLHAITSLMDKQPFMLNPDEQMHQYIETVTIETLYPDGLPEAIIYPTSETVSLDDDG